MSIELLVQPNAAFSIHKHVLFVLYCIVCEENIYGVLLEENMFFYLQCNIVSRYITGHTHSIVYHK